MTVFQQLGKFIESLGQRLSYTSSRQTYTRISTSNRPMTPEEIAAFDRAFKHMGKAFDELENVFELAANPPPKK